METLSQISKPSPTKVGLGSLGGIVVTLLVTLIVIGFESKKHVAHESSASSFLDCSVMSQKMKGKNVQRLFLRCENQKLMQAVLDKSVSSKKPDVSVISDDFDKSGDSNVKKNVSDTVI